LQIGTNYDKKHSKQEKYPTTGNTQTLFVTKIHTTVIWPLYSGANPRYQVRGTHWKKLRRAEGGAKIFGVLRERPTTVVKYIIISRLRFNIKYCTTTKIITNKQILLPPFIYFYKIKYSVLKPKIYILFIFYSHN
jgi:hypothetical protein